MNIHLNNLTQSHLAETVGNLQMQFNTSNTSSAPAGAVVNIYDAVLLSMEICRIDEGTIDYIKTMVRDHDYTSSHNIETYISILQNKIRNSGEDFYPADFALRCLLAVLRNGQMRNPDSNRTIYQKLLGTGRMTKAMRIDWEENQFQFVALKLTGIVNYHYRRKQTYSC